MKIDDRCCCSRREFLAAGAKLGLAGTLATTSDVFANQQFLKFEQWYGAPEGFNWRIVDSHATGYVTPDSRLKLCGQESRLNFGSNLGGYEAYTHVVKKDEHVYPLGIDSARIHVDFSSISRVLLRYHHWIEDYSGQPGKWIGLQLGRGWVGTNYVKDSNVLYGSDGGSVTTMHPEREGKNGIRLLATHSAQTSPYGENIGNGSQIVPSGKWNTVDVVVDRDDGYRLYLDGVLQAQASNIKPVNNWDACRVIWYRTRNMHGGEPQLLPALRDYQEHFGSFYVAVA